MLTGFAPVTFGSGIVGLAYMDMTTHSSTERTHKNTVALFSFVLQQEVATHFSKNLIFSAMLDCQVYPLEAKLPHGNQGDFIAIKLPACC
jgi:hypothetical protein